MSRRCFFTVDEALASLLLQDEQEFVDGVPLDEPGSDTEYDADDSDSDNDDDSEHFLAAELNIDVAANAFSRRASSDDEPMDDSDGEVSEPDAPAPGPVAVEQASATAAAASPNCGCSRNCLSQFRLEEIQQNRLNVQELDKLEFDMMLMGVLEAIRFAPRETAHKRKRVREAFSYAFQSQRVCVGAFRYIYDVGRDKLKRISQHVYKNGAVPRRNGNSGRRPANAFKFEEVKYAVTFINAHSNKHGIPHPAPLHGRAGVPPVFLPASQTYKSVHKDYVAAGNLAGVRVMGESSFRSVWHQCTPHIVFMTPRTDVYDLCEVLRRGVMTSLTEQDKLAACTLLSNHIATAQRERDHYRKLTQTASDQLKAIQPLPSAPQQPCSTLALKTHYTFDFAQNVCIPHESRQVGPIYR
eukprot:scpid69560/ scgid15699/ 